MKPNAVLDGAKAYIFDMDGTLVDNLAYHVRAYHIFSRRYGHELTDAQIIGWTGATNRYFMERILGRPASADEAKRMENEKESLYRTLYAPHLALAPGARELLDRALRAGIVCAVASGAPTQNIDFVLGVGLAMDAFSVSMANGLHDPKMNKGTMCKIAGTFGLFQAAMPMIGWVCVHTIVELFSSFETLIPWIALALLGYIGGKMLLDGIRGEEAEEAAELSAGALFMQGVATSIDALSVGFTISEYGWLMALTAAIIIAVVTFILCMAGLRIGKKFGTQLSGKANILGGVILIGIGLEIFLTGVF